jgi:hypothetical protein
MSPPYEGGFLFSRRSKKHKQSLCVVRHHRHWKPIFFLTLTWHHENGKNHHTKIARLLHKQTNKNRTNEKNERTNTRKMHWDGRKTDERMRMDEVRATRYVPASLPFFFLSLSLSLSSFGENFTKTFAASPHSDICERFVFGRAISCAKEREFWSEGESLSIGNFSAAWEFLWSVVTLFPHLLDQSRIPLFAFRFLEDSGFWNFAEEKGQTLFSSFDRCWIRLRVPPFGWEIWRLLQSAVCFLFGGIRVSILLYLSGFGSSHPFVLQGFACDVGTETERLE